jgi:hypothetical protein
MLAIKQGRYPQPHEPTQLTIKLGLQHWKIIAYSMCDLMTRAANIAAAIPSAHTTFRSGVVGYCGCSNSSVAHNHSPRIRLAATVAVWTEV